MTVRLFIQLIGLFCIQSSCAFTNIRHDVASSRGQVKHPSFQKRVLPLIHGKVTVPITGTSTLYMSHHVPGDKLRDSTGKRPSLNPTIINIISEALSLRASNDASLPMESSSTVQPIEVAIAAGKLAKTAIESREKSSSAVKGDESSAFTQDESHLIAGRILGVVMRWNVLEQTLVDKVKGTPWVSKYGEEASFGVLAVECKDGENDDNDKVLKKRLEDDPLFRMCRAECLYALFLKTIEIPTMAKIGQLPADGANGVDFLDSDRIGVLFPGDLK
jgi:hypothetical protein